MGSQEETYHLVYVSRDGSLNFYGEYPSLKLAHEAAPEIAGGDLILRGALPDVEIVWQSPGYQERRTRERAEARQLAEMLQDFGCSSLSCLAPSPGSDHVTAAAFFRTDEWFRLRDLVEAMEDLHREFQARLKGRGLTR